MAAVPRTNKVNKSMSARKRSMATPVCHWLGLAAAVACNRCLSLCITSKEFILSQPLFVKPASRYVCPKRKTRIEGSNIHRLAAIARPSCFVSRLAGSVKKRDSGQYCGDSKKVIGCSMAFQASKNPSVRADIRPGIPNGIPMRQKTLPLICTIDRSGLQDFSRNRVKAALHDKYRKCRKDAR